MTPADLDRLESVVDSYDYGDFPIVTKNETMALIEAARERDKLKETLSRIQRLPQMDKARASAAIMQVAAQLARMPEAKKAKQLQDAVDQWATYTCRVEDERDELKAALEMVEWSNFDCCRCARAGGAYEMCPIGEPHCPECDMGKWRGHADDCQIARLLK